MQIYDFVCKLPRKQVGMNITFCSLGRLDFLLLDINKNPQCLTEDIADFFESVVNLLGQRKIHFLSRRSKLIDTIFVSIFRQLVFAKEECSGLHD